MIDRSADGRALSVTSFARPLKVAVVITDPPSSRSFRAAVLALSTRWGGARSVIVSGTRTAAIGEGWAAAVAALDPDLIFVSERLYRRDTRARLESYLDRRVNVPFAVAKLNPQLMLSPFWRTASVGSVLQSPSNPATSATRRSGPVEVAVRGLVPDAPVGGRRGRPSTATFVRNSPAGLAATGVPGYRLALPGSLFLYHDRSDVAAAMWLWNLRGVYGQLRHGNQSAILADIRTRPAGLGRLTTAIYLDAIPKSARAALSSAGVSDFVAARDFKWGRTLAGGLVFDQERDDVSVVNETFSIPRRTPVVRAAGLGVPQSEATGIDGAYAVELAISTGDPPGKRYSIAARAASLNGLTPAPGVAAGLLPTQSRPTRAGDTVLLVRPGRFGRALRLSLPRLGPLIAQLSPGVRWELSDKGHFTRWFVRHAGGLFDTHELLTDPRGSVLFEALRSHHSPGKRIAKSYRRFMTVDDMRKAFAETRAAGTLAKRMADPDQAFLDSWIGRLVSSEILRLGILTKCEDCLDTSFLAVGTFGRTFNCPRCGETARTPAVPVVGYQLAEVAHQFLVNDGDVNVLAVTALARRARNGFSYDFDHNVLEGTSKREVDFIAILDGRVVVGESKKAGDVDRGDCDLLQRVAGKLRAWAVVIATHTECSPCGADCVNDLRSDSRTRDQSLPPGAGGPRDQVKDLRGRLAPETLTLVLCRSDLRAPALPNV